MKFDGRSSISSWAKCQLRFIFMVKGSNSEVRGASPEGEASSREAATSTVVLCGDGKD